MPDDATPTPTDAHLIAHAAWCLERHAAGTLALSPDTHVLCQYAVSRATATATLTDALRSWLLRLRVQYPTESHDGQLGTPLDGST